MVRLSEISAKTIIPNNAHDIKKLVEENNVESVEELLYLSHLHKEYDWSEIYRMLLGDFEKSWNMSLQNGYIPEIFTTKGYSDEKLKKQDVFNKGSILLLNSPLTIQSAKYECLETKTIKTIKSDLSHTFPNGSNYLSAGNPEYMSIGSHDISRIVSSIEMYEEQIERQAQLTKERNINLFELHKLEKLALIEELYNEIIMYLLDHTKERLVWGELTALEKKAYLSSAINEKQEDIIIKEIIKAYIANYTTIKELEDVLNYKLKVLKRFIVK